MLLGFFLSGLRYNSEAVCRSLSEGDIRFHIRIPPCRRGISQQPNNSTIQQFNNSTTQQLNNPTTQQFNNSTIQQPNNPTTQQLNNSTIQQPNNSTIQQLNNPTTQHFFPNFAPHDFKKPNKAYHLLA